MLNSLFNGHVVLINYTATSALPLSYTSSMVSSMETLPKSSNSELANSTTALQKESPSKPVKAVKNGVIKKRGRPPKVKPENGTEDVPSKQTKITDTMKKARRTVDRFNGVSKEELMQRFLPDRIKHDLDILIIGINPGLFAAYKGHHYAGPGNHFWSCINMSGMVDKPTSSENDADMLDYGIGFCTIVQRTTPSAKDLTSKEIREGAKDLIEKIKNYKPKIAVFNGKGIYEIFSKEMFGQKKKDFVFGRQPNTIPETDTLIFVMPSSSARCAQFPRAQDKVHYYIQIKKLRDQLKGLQTNGEVEETNYTFDLQKATEMAKIDKIKTEPKDPSYDENNKFPTANPFSANAATDVPDQPGCSRNCQQPAKNATVAPAKGRGRGRQVSGAASGHPHLVKFLCQNEDKSAAAAKSAGALSLRTPMPQLQEVVSDEQKNERVGKWVRTQMNQDYENELPMGYEELIRAGDMLEQPESDRGSQRSMVSAGVSGSTSTGSTSGYGSVDNTAHSHRAQQDRVERWVREQQYVRQQHNPQPARPAEHDGHAAPVVAAPEVPVLSFDAWNSFAVRPGSSSAGNSMEGAFRPPVPLYSSWGGNDVAHFSGLTSNMNNNANMVAHIGHAQMKANLP